ncbi:uncharacterized protein BDV17DRAFT_291432 [Aspergillus undulatus]|uniref:uncharacterized protein n=1 Tax=Aspergillus undulatus TaxID=1810928 RepID=UPI003CCE221C
MHIGNLRDCARFPTLSNLPSFLSSQTSSPSLPPIRECFVAEILSIEQWTPAYHTRLLVEDFNRTTATLGCSFPQDERGGLLVSSLQPGYALLVLNPYKQMLKHGKIGIEIGDVSRVKVLPFNMQALIRLNNTLLEFTSEIGGKRCYGCRMRFDSKFFQVCEKCRFIFFCGIACQRESIADGNHQLDCDILRDPDLEALFKGKWDCLDGFVVSYLDDRSLLN